MVHIGICVGGLAVSYILNYSIAYVLQSEVVIHFLIYIVFKSTQILIGVMQLKKKKK